MDDAILARLDKGHTRADFLGVVARFRPLGLVLQPTFVPFTPWTTLAGYRDLLDVLADTELIENVAPIQLGIRLLDPGRLATARTGRSARTVGPFEPSGLVYPWSHADPCLDALAARVQELAAEGDRLRRSRSETFALIWQAACVSPLPPTLGRHSRSRISPSLVLLRGTNAGQFVIDRASDHPDAVNANRKWPPRLGQ